MGFLIEERMERIYHYTPLHYLPFIGRSKSLLNKPSLVAAAFAPPLIDRRRAEQLDPMIAGPEGGPSSDMQRYEG
jgi:hypothetical protein